MENSNNGAEGILKDGQAGIPDGAEKEVAPDRTRAYIDINKDGWITATIHISKGLYPIIGFLAEVQDVARIQIAQAMKRATEKTNLIKPGFRGFNPFGKK